MRSSSMPTLTARLNLTDILKLARHVTASTCADVAPTKTTAWAHALAWAAALRGKRFPNYDWIAVADGVDGLCPRFAVEWGTERYQHEKYVQRITAWGYLA